MNNATLAARSAALILSSAVAVLGTYAVLHEPVTTWFAAATLGWLLVLMLAAVSLFRTGLFGIVATLFATIVVGRLVSTVHLVPPDASTAATADPLLLAETGPGIPHLTYLTLALGIVLVALLALRVWQRHRENPTMPGDEGWSLAFVRIYVGLMFIPHFAAHIFAGPMPFGIFWKYFGELGFPVPAAMVVLAGLVELAVAIGLSFGFLTRLAGAVGAFYLYLTMLLGNHFPVGYIRILPTGGYEFGIFWAVMAAVFVVAGGGSASLDHWFRNRTQQLPRWMSALLR